MFVTRHFLLTSVIAITGDAAFHGRTSEVNGINPIRKVVNLLQGMQKKVQAEGEKEKELYEKFECYCKTNGDELSLSISGANTKIPALQSDIEAATAKKAQLEEDLKQHQGDRAAAIDAMKSATAIHEKAAAAFAKEKAEYEANIGALTKAIAAISRGMAGGFLQTRTAAYLRKLVASVQDMDDSNREELLAFLSGDQTNEYVPQSSEVVGILKQLQDEMVKSLQDAETVEKDRVTDYNDLMTAKKKEEWALTMAIEKKSKRAGDLAVEITTMKNDLTDTEAALVEDTKFLANLKKDCGTKAADWEARSKTRAEELVAISETIALLNSDDALELFKKTLPSASLVQVIQSTEAARERAYAMIRTAQLVAKGSPQLDFIAMALRGKKIGLEKVMKMIDDMVANLKTEQKDDDNKKEYCAVQLDESDDKKKVLEHTISDLEIAMGKATEGIATVKEEIKALQAGLKALDKSVKEASELRKKENLAYTELMSSNNAAIDILHMAINRLNQFYNPKLAKDEPALVGIKIHAHDKAAPPPPPETYGAYAKKTEASGGVVSMIKMLVSELEKEITEATTSEQDSQKEYADLMNDSAEKKASDTKSLNTKQTAKAALETQLQTAKEDKTSAGKELNAVTKAIQLLHGECDWLMKYFDVRKEARAGEIDALNQAKAVLSGADFSML